MTKEQSLNGSGISGILWDFDGTIMDTTSKTFSVLCKLIPKITKKSLNEFPILLDKSTYLKTVLKTNNWKELYKNYLGLSDFEIDCASRSWSENYQHDSKRILPFPGIIETLKKLSNTPQGIVSNNDSEIIKAALSQFQILDNFSFIISGQTLPERLQKPNPHLLLEGIRKLPTSNSNCIIFIGDHYSDFIMAGQTIEYLKEKKSNISIVTIQLDHFKTNRIELEKWPHLPQFYLESSKEICDILNFKSLSQKIEFKGSIS